MIRSKPSTSDDRPPNIRQGTGRRCQNEHNQQQVAGRGNDRYRWRRQQPSNQAPPPSNQPNQHEPPRHNRRFHGHQNRQFRSRNHVHESFVVPASDNTSSSPATTPSAPVLPGFIYDEAKKKYFRIAQENSGISGFTRNDVMRARRDKDRASLLANNRPRFASESFAVRPIVRPITQLVRGLSLSGRSFNAPFEQRRLAEARLLNVKAKPHTIVENPLSAMFSVRGCQFLSVSADGRSVLGCWAAAAQFDAGRDAASILCLRAHIDEEKRTAALIEGDNRPANVTQPLLNTMGLTFSAHGQYCEVSDPSLVDMCIAPVDSDVTCCLYVTAATRMSPGGLRTRCSIFLQPVAEMSTPDCVDILNSPIYNLYWTAESSIWSCAWSGNKMRVALGLEDSAKIMDVVTEQHFVISSKRKNVLSQQFSPDGNLIYMGLRADDVIRSDLRMSSKHVTGAFRGSRNAGSIHLLKSAHPDCLITETFTGELKLWDSRRSDRALLSFKGHKNSHYRLPCHVDHNERFVFAVGQDGTTRGWSLSSGNLLCAVPSPRPIEERTDFPRVVYSDCWAGIHGNAALVLAVGDTCRVHQLDL